jgi:hypothetical protein
MKKLASFIVFVTLVTSITAQSKSGTVQKPLKTAKAAPVRDTSLCNKKWTLVAVEEWAVESKPKKKQVDDYLSMTGDGKFNLKRNGEAKAGTWTKSAAYINFTDDASKEKFTYKVESTDQSKLKVDYHVGDMHTLFSFEAK